MRRWLSRVRAWFAYVGRVCPGGEGRIGPLVAWDLARIEVAVAEMPPFCGRWQP